MCGRYRIKDTEQLSRHLRKTLGLPEWLPDYNEPHYNIAPSQDCPVVVMDDEHDAQPVSVKMRWGFVPAWEQAERPRFAPINTRSEKIAEQRFFGDAVQRRRCLVPADGFYEWLRYDEKTKYPFDLHLRDSRPFVMAGIYEQPNAGRPATFAILTTSANEFMARIHDRMPVILEGAAADTWLRSGPLDGRQLAELTRPIAAEAMAAVPISALVNSARYDGPEILEPTAPPPPRACQGELF